MQRRNGNNFVPLRRKIRQFLSYEDIITHIAHTLYAGRYGCWSAILLPNNRSRRVEWSDPYPHLHLLDAFLHLLRCKYQGYATFVVAPMAYGGADCW